MLLKGQTAIITGGSRGIGRAIAVAFANEGADVAFCHLDDDDAAEVTAGLVTAAGRRVLHESCDIADVEQGRAFATRASWALGEPTILVNNAGRYAEAAMETLTPAFFDEMAAINLRGLMFMTQAVYPAMVKRGYGRIINIASQLGLRGGLGLSVYSATKAGVIGFTRSFALEAMPHGIGVNAIAPGPTDTQPLRDLSEGARSSLKARLPAGRFGQPEEIAATALLLAGPQGGFYVGACLSPNGGDIMH
jgi:3-oxoacyl-[acyl-carrier protein] reductase